VTTIASELPRPPDILSNWLTVLLAMSCGLIVANLYYAQPLIGLIAADLGLSPQSAGLIVTVTQLGYGAGLLLVVPLGDLVENRRLVVGISSLGALALLAAAFATHPLPFLIAGLCIGFGSVAVQILIPYAGHLAPPEIRGRVVGNVTTGLMIGVLLSRPASSFIAAASSWHAVYKVSACGMILLALVLHRMLPQRYPTARLGYGQLLASMMHMARTNVVLRRRALYQAALFGVFSMFWTTAPLLLAGPAFHLTQRGIAMFALAGVAGAISAPLAGRVADRGWTRPATAAVMLLTASGFALTRLGVGVLDRHRAAARGPDLSRDRFGIASAASAAPMSTCDIRDRSRDPDIAKAHPGYLLNRQQAATRRQRPAAAPPAFRRASAAGRRRTAPRAVARRATFATRLLRACGWCPARW
jgi:predicted MFS family arabinose efflux permease